MDQLEQQESALVNMAGDALLSLASGVLADSGTPAALRGMRLLNTAVQGRIMDLAFE